MKLTHYKISFLFVVLCASMNVHETFAANWLPSFFPKFGGFSRLLHPRALLSVLFMHITPAKQADCENIKQSVQVLKQRIEDIKQNQQKLSIQSMKETSQELRKQHQQRMQEIAEINKKLLRDVDSMNNEIAVLREQLKSIGKNAQQQSQNNQEYFKSSLGDVTKKLDDRSNTMERKLESELSKNNQIISETREAVDQFGVHAQRARRMINGLPGRVSIEAQNLKFGVLGALTQQSWNN